MIAQVFVVMLVLVLMHLRGVLLLGVWGKVVQVWTDGDFLGAFGTADPAHHVVVLLLCYNVD